MASRGNSRTRQNQGGKSDAPAPVLKLSGGPPKVGGSGSASWFQALKSRKPDGPEPHFPGSGVPVNDNVDPKASHGYWRRQRRFKPGKGGRKPVGDAWYFYYTGTGPLADLQYADPHEDVVWVKAKGADTSTRSRQGTRDPDKFDQFPLRFADGGPDNGFRWDFIPTNRGRSGRSSAATSREQSRNGSRATTPERRGRASSVNEDLIQKAADIILKNQGKSGKITKAKANEMAERRYCKRVLAPGKDVDSVFGARTKNKPRNFGDDKMVEEGIRDGRTTAMLNIVPSSHALLFGGEVQSKFNPEGLAVTFTFTTTVDRNDPQFDNYVKICNECVNGVGTRPSGDTKPKSKPSSRAQSPAPKPQRKKQQKKKQQDEDVVPKDEQEVNDQLEFDEENPEEFSDRVNWGDSALGSSEI